MLPVELKPDLLDKLKQGLVRIMITTDTENPAETSTDYVYTLNNTCDKYRVPDGVTPPVESDSTVVAWNILKSKYSVLNLDQIGVYKIYTDREEFKTDDGMAAKHTYNHQTSINNVDWMLGELDCCCSDKRITCSRDELIDIMCNPGTDTHYTPRCWDTLKTFKFKINNIHDLCRCHEDEVLFEAAKQGYMDCIRDCRDESFVELDQLEVETKSNGGSAEDLQDIDTIKQMFRDIPQDTNLDEAETVMDLVEVWPSLLLPSTISTEVATALKNGDVQRSLYEKNKRDDDNVPQQDNEDVDSMIKEVDNLEDLKAMHDHITSGDCLILENMTEEQKNDTEIWRNYVIVCQSDVDAISKRIKELETTT
jgi:hypothetical protein